MDLKEMMSRFGGHGERLPDAEIKFGKEIELDELVKALDAWQEVWEKLEPSQIDQLSHSEQQRLKRELKACADTLTQMTFRLDVFDGYSKEFVRAKLLEANPDQPYLIQELFGPQSWWLLISYTKDITNGGCMDFCHVNTRKIARLRIAATSPIIEHFGMREPIAPHGEVVIFCSDYQNAPAV